MTDHLAIGIAQAVADVRSRLASLEPALERAAFAQRLRAEAALAVGSPLAHDQLVAVALTTVAEDAGQLPVEAALATFLHAADPLEQLTLRQAVLEDGDDDVLDFEVGMAVVFEERRGVALVGRDPSTLALHLRRAAALNRSLWDHPVLLAETHVRAAMLAGGRALEERAERVEASSRRRSSPSIAPRGPVRTRRS